MFIKLTRSGPNQYVQLVEAFRDDSGRPKQRTVATLGRLDQLRGELQSVISGLQRITGQTPVASPPTPTVSFESARDFGDVWTLTELWNSLGFDRLRKVFRHTRHSIGRCQGSCRKNFDAQAASFSG
ncbi:Mobile element protein [Polaromonas sp. CG9_12]|nr:Mobile element protein [Polaromonas sp. CG9_12]